MRSSDFRGGPTKRSKFSDGQILAIVKEGEAGRKAADLRQAGLQVRCRRRKRLIPRGAGPAAGADPTQRAVVDGLHARHPGGWPRVSHAGHRRRVHAQARRDCEVDRSLPGLRVTCGVERLRLTRGLPASSVLDTGPEFAGGALEAWAHAAGATPCFPRAGKPVEKAYIESFNGKFRDECMNEHWCVSLTDARAVIEAWRVDDNTVRPHSVLGERTPHQFVASTEVPPACIGTFRDGPQPAVQGPADAQRRRKSRRRTETWQAQPVSQSIEPRG